MKDLLQQKAGFYMKTEKGLCLKNGIINAVNMATRQVQIGKHWIDEKLVILY